MELFKSIKFKYLVVLISGFGILFSFLYFLPKITRAQTPEIHLNDSITKPYYLNQANTTYILDTDIKADGSAFILDGDNITLDLNGKTVTFGNINVAGIPNYDFEQGSGEVPDRWDLSGASSAKRVSTSERPLIGDWQLKFDAPSTTQEIISDWVNLPQANRTYLAAVIVSSCWGCMHRLKVEGPDGAIVVENSSDNVERAPMLSVQFKAPSAGNYRLHIIFENPNGRSSYIDYADLRPAYDAGILMRGYFDSVRTPDLVGLPSPGNHTNFTIRNGRIIEGAGKGMKYRAIHKSSSGLLEIDNVYSEVSGINASNFWAEYSSNTDFHDSTLVNRAAYLIDRMALDNFPVYLGSDSKFYNNTIEGGQGGVSVAGFSNIEIYNSTFRINAKVTNHYAITTYSTSNLKIYNNRFEPYNGPGILFSSSTTNSEIYNNYFNITNFPCPPEYYTGLNTPIIRVTDYLGGTTRDNKIYNNLMIGTAKSFSEYPLCRPSIIAFRLGNSGVNNQYFNNIVQLKTLDNKAEAIGIMSSGTSVGVFQENVIESNNLIAWFGDSNGPSGNGDFISNTFVKGANPINYHTFRIGYCCGINAENHHFLDTRLVNGASLDDIIWGVGSGGGDYSYDLKWYLNLRVTDGASAIEGAQVTVNDKDGQNVFLGTTNASGRVTNIELKQFSRSGTYAPLTSNYTYSTPHTLTVSKAGFPTETKTLTMDASKEMTVILDGQEVEPPIISNVTASNITENSATITWQTDREADSKVEYGLDTNYGTTLTDANMTTNHSISLTNLSPNTYHFRVTSKDASGKENIGTDHTFFILPPVGQGIILTKSVDKNSASSGDILTYTVTYTVGTQSITNAVLQDSIPLGTTYIQGSATNNGSCDVTKCTWGLDNLAPGATGQVQFQVRVE